MISEVVLHKQGNSGRTVVKDQIEAVLLPNHCRHQRLEESFLYQIKENGYLALSPRLSNRNKIKKRRKEKTTKKTKTTTKKTPLSASPRRISTDLYISRGSPAG